MVQQSEKPRQLPLDFSHPPGYSRDDLVVSPANEEAVSLIDRWPDWPASVMVLSGPTGAGKTHLAAIWRAQTGAVALNPDDISSSLATLETRPVLLDDIDRAPIDETGLFHLINNVRANDSHLLITARRFPAAWGVMLADLVSRLKAAPVVEIREPDDLLLAGVITKLFADRQIEVDLPVIQYLVRRIERSLATAIRVVERLDRMALEEHSRITRALAAEAVNAMDEGQAEFDL